MIREFHDEITRLRAELEQFSGGKINFDQGTGAPGQQLLEVEKYIHVENK